MKAHFLSALALCACSPVFGVQGSGVEASESRSVEPFDRIELDGSADVIVHVGKTQSVTVRCDDNLLEHVRTRVVHRTLEIGMDSGTWFIKKGLRVEISVPRLEGAEIAGSGDVAVQDLDADTFEVSIAGSGHVGAAGRAERLTVEIAGSGDVELYSVAAKSASVEIAGSGSAGVSASEELDASIFGSGSVRYRGEPRVTRKVAGSGSVAKDQ